MMHVKTQVATIWLALALFKSTTRLRWVQPSPLIPSMVVPIVKSNSMFGRLYNISI